jgi:uncharacterized membrane protein YsdA (DUF1294 family)
MPQGIRPHTFHGLLSLVLALALTLGLFALVRPKEVSLWHLLAFWLLAVNVVAFCYYGWDKMRAIGERSRVPELVLHGLAVAGGTVGAYAGMRLFRHKTVKGSFRIIFWFIAVVQVCLVVAALYRLWANRGE